MGNFIGSIEEGLETDSVHQKFNKSKDFLRVYVANGGEMKKVLSVKASDNDGHGLKTEVKKQLSKKAQSILVLSKNISFRITIVYTDDDGKDQIYNKTIRSNPEKSVSEPLNEKILIENVRRFRGVALFAPSHSKELYKNFPDDMMNLIEKKRNWVENQGLMMREKVREMRKEGGKNKKLDKIENTQIVEGFESNVLWGLDGRVRRIEVDTDHAFSPAI